MSKEGALHLRPSWEAFDECPECFAGPKRPCFSLKGTSRNLKECKVPHRGRKPLSNEERTEAGTTSS